MNFDLTTKKGAEDANTWLGNIKEVASFTALGLVLGAPISLLGYGAYKLSKSLLPSEDPILKQIKAVEDLIKAGRQNGVKKMRVTIDREAGLQFDSNIEGITIKMSAGSKGKVDLEVEYA